MLLKTFVSFSLQDFKITDLALFYNQLLLMQLFKMSATTKFSQMESHEYRLHRQFESVQNALKWRPKLAFRPIFTAYFPKFLSLSLSKITCRRNYRGENKMRPKLTSFLFSISSVSCERSASKVYAWQFKFFSVTFRICACTQYYTYTQTFYTHGARLMTCSIGGSLGQDKAPKLTQFSSIYVACLRAYCREQDPPTHTFLAIRLMLKFQIFTTSTRSA